METHADGSEAHAVPSRPMPPHRSGRGRARSDRDAPVSTPQLRRARVRSTIEDARKSRPIRVLVIDDDAGVRDVVAAILGDEGYEVSMLDHLADAVVRAAIDRIEPNCILLDGAEAIGYAKAWTTAADMRRRARPIPTVMFTAHVLDAAGAARRSRRRRSRTEATRRRVPVHMTKAS